MSSVRGKNTLPEMLVRRFLHASGLRFRLHVKDLPGRPDIVFPKYRTVVFVHGCFWHRHQGCSKATIPDANQVFWQEKFKRNVERDARNIAQLQLLSWRVLVVWECEANDGSALARLARLIRRK